MKRYDTQDNSIEKVVYNFVQKLTKFYRKRLTIEKNSIYETECAEELKEYCEFIVWGMLLEFFLTHSTTLRSEREEEMKMEVFLGANCCIYRYIHG